MKITDNMIDYLRKMINNKMDMIFHIIEKDKNIFIYFVNYHLTRSKQHILKEINEITNLEWEYFRGGIFYLKKGYVVFYEEAEADGRDYLMEEYHEIEDNEFHSPILFVDGKQEHCESFDPNCPCAFHSWEKNIDIFRFERSLPNDKNNP